MNTIQRFGLAVLLGVMTVSDVQAQDTLDTLLPPPFWFRSRAEELHVDADTRNRIEVLYQAQEPEYHVLKAKVERLTEELNETLVAGELNQELILQRMESLLDAESDLKLHQVRVRISLLSEVSAEQRRQARELARRQPKPDVAKVMQSKVERIRSLSEQVSNAGGSIAGVDQKLEAAEQTIAGGDVMEGARMLDGIIRELESVLEPGE